MKRWIGQLNICLVEDSEDYAEFLRQYLEMQGHIVHAVSDVQSGLLILATRQIDIIVCDIRLPDASGWDLMRLARVRNCAPAGIAISGYTTRADQERSRQAGYYFHLRKPFLLEQIRTMVTDAVLIHRGEKLWENENQKHGLSLILREKPSVDILSR